MPSTLRKVAVAFQRAVQNFINDGCPTHAAALAYYSLFSLPPLILILTRVAAALFDEETVREEVISLAREMFGGATADQVRVIVERASMPTSGLGLAAAISIGALIFASTTAFTELQYSLNRAWGATEGEDVSVFRSYLLKRAVSFGLVLVLGSTLLVSLGFSAALAALGERFALVAFQENFLHTMEFFTSWIILAALVAGAFYFLPDIRVPGRDALLGGALTALAFVVGKQLLGIYIGRAQVGSAYGSASSLALMLLAVYVGAATLLFGAELTQAWGALRGGPRRPRKRSSESD